MQRASERSCDLDAAWRRIVGDLAAPVPARVGEEGLRAMAPLASGASGDAASCDVQDTTRARVTVLPAGGHAA